MYSFIALAACLLTGVMLKAQGVLALLWTPLGFGFGLFLSAQIFLPVLLGIPRAIWLASKGQMRLSACARILATPAIWLVQLAVIGFIVGFFWPKVAESAYNNLALNLGTNLGMLAVLLCPLSAKCRSDFVDDFNRVYQRFFTELGKAKYLVGTDVV
jgi:hypothetical protein